MKEEEEEEEEARKKEKNRGNKAKKNSKKADKKADKKPTATEAGKVETPAAGRPPKKPAGEKGPVSKAESQQAGVVEDQEHGMQEVANAALTSAITSDNLDAIVSALSEHADNGSTDVVTAARTKRDRMKKTAKKTKKLQQHQQEAEMSAPGLLKAMADANTAAVLALCIEAAAKFEGLVPSLDTGIAVARERLPQLITAEQPGTLIVH